MSSVVIFPVVDQEGVTHFRAVSNAAQSEGATAGQALDALRQCLPDQGTTVVVVQSLAGDEFFSKAQRSRLSELMNRWRDARDAGTSLPAEEQAELEHLTKLEFEAAIKRSAKLAGV